MSEFERFEIRALPPFAEAARRLLTDEQVHQIKQDLAANPFVGEPVDEADGMLRYRFDKVDVYYLVAAELNRL